MAISDDGGDGVNLMGDGGDDGRCGGGGGGGGGGCGRPSPGDVFGRKEDIEGVKGGAEEGRNK